MLGMPEPAGYLHPGYARSLAEFGRPRMLPHCGGWVLERAIDGHSDRDAVGCYPLFCCGNWENLVSDLEDLGRDLVSVTLVADPFGAYDPGLLRRCFDVVVPFKEHYAVDCSQPMGVSISRNHQYQTRRALKEVHVEKCADPSAFLEEWIALYRTLIRRHALKGIHAFSRQVFAAQLALPGLTVWRAVHEGCTVGALLVYEQAGIAYAHLAASSETGYRLGAAYALFWCAIEHSLGKVRWFSLGARAGLADGATTGLDFFKKGWATGTRTTYLCGRILNPERYAALVQSRGISATKYFPAYRQGEFT
jgi:hypothetical protein